MYRSNLAIDDDLYDDAYAEGYASQENEICPYTDSWRQTAWIDGQTDHNNDNTVSEFININ